MKNLKIILFVLMLSIPLANASNYVGKVIRSFGKVTILDPGALKARALKTGEKVTKDSSILTKDKSFAKIKLNDDSVLNIGPNSKIIVDLSKSDESDVNIVTLLKGKMRANVKPLKNIKDNKNSKKEKFLLKTTTAALGVRGTDFSTVYNPELKQTSLVTYEGEVAFSQVQDRNLFDEDAKEQLREEISVEDNGDVKIQRSSRTILDANDRVKISRALRNKSTVIVKAGQYSGTVKNLGVVSKPVKISPVQLEHLVQNEALQDVDSQRQKKVKAKLQKSSYRVKQADQLVPESGILEVKEKIYAPKAGGFVDFSTGLYVAPSQKAKYDAKAKVYVPEQVGAVDKFTGDYLPPIGMKLDSKNGFVPKIKSEKLIAMSSNLNNSIAKDLVIDNVENKEDLVKYLGLRELFSKNIISLSMLGSSAHHRINDDSNRGSYDYDINSGGSLQLSWLQSAKGLWQTFVVFSKYNNDKDEQHQSVAQTDQDTNLYGLQVGARRFHSNRFFSSWAVEVDQSSFVDTDATSSDNGSRQLKNISLTKFSGGVGWWAISSRKFKLITLANIKYSLSKDSGDHEVSSGIETHLELTLRYHLTQKYNLEAGVFNSTMDKEISHSVFTAREDIDFSGLKFSASYIF